MTDKLIIPIDVTDWQEETQEDERVIASKEDVLANARDGVSVQKIARAAVVCRATGIAPADLISPDKLLLMAGAQSDVIAMIHSEKREVTVESGQTYEVNALIGKGSNNETDSTSSYVPIEDEEGVARAKHYLEKVVPGHIWNPLLTIYNDGGTQDVNEAADLLIAEIGRMVDRITQPGIQ